MARVLIVTPTYNHADYLAECIESVLAQTFQDWSLVIVDDGSTDRTREVTSAFPDPRIKFIAREHHGLHFLAETYNVALQSEDSEFVAILEGDDYWPADKLSNQVPLFDDSEVVLVSGGLEIVDSLGETLDIHPSIPGPEAICNDPLGAGTLALMDHRHLTFTFPVSTVIRRSTLDKIGGFQQVDYLPLVDLPTFVAISHLGQFRWCDQVSGYWRRHERSTTSSRLPEILDGVYRYAGNWLHTRSKELKFDPGVLEAWTDSWSAFMVHRLVLLSHELSMLGDDQGAVQAAKLARSFKGPMRRSAKSLGAILASRLHLPDKAFRIASALGRTTNHVPPRDQLVSRESLNRIKAWS